MPAKPPTIPDTAAQQLRQLGAALARARKAQRVPATVAAEAAGLSRPTLHRIEKGEPNVSAAAWAAVADALGLKIGLIESAAEHGAVIPRRILLDDYPQLKQLAWQLQGVEALEPEQALQLYERNWRHVDRMKLSLHEIALIRALAERFGAGELLV